MSGVICNCAACGMRINETEQTLTDDRRPCPACGSMARRFSILAQTALNEAMARPRDESARKKD